MIGSWVIRSAGTSRLKISIVVCMANTIFPPGLTHVTFIVLIPVPWLNSSMVHHMPLYLVVFHPTALQGRCFMPPLPINQKLTNFRTDVQKLYSIFLSSSFSWPLFLLNLVIAISPNNRTKSGLFLASL